MSPSASDVSVVTVNWNGRERLSELLPSLTGLGCREILVVDNASQDGSVEFLKRRWPQVRVLENPVNRGFAHPCNLGASEAAGSILAFINNDMRADRNWIDSALRRLTAGTPCVASRILDWSGERVDYNGSSLQYLGYALQNEIGRPVQEASSPREVLFPCGGAMLIDRSVFLEAGGFDQDYFAIFEDVDLGWRLWIAGHRVAFSAESIAFHRGHATFQTQPDEKMRYLMHRNALWTILKNYEDATFRRVLPLAVALAVKRAVRLSGARRESFYLWETTRERLRLGDPDVQDQLLDSLNHLVAVDDVLTDLPRILEKRKSIQTTRKRSDAEVVGLFGDPLRAIVDDPEYLDAELSWLRGCGLERLFELPSRPARSPGLPDRLQDRIDSLRHELLALQWVDGKNRISPPSKTGGGASALMAVWKRHGLRHAWSLLKERIDRGV